MSSTDLLAYSHDSFHGWIGIARTDITPPVGIYARNWGAAKHDLAESIHRPLTLTALTLATSASGPWKVFVDADLGWWKSLSTAQRFLDRIQKSLSLKSADLIFAITHTHSGPPLMDIDDSLPGSELLRTWFERLVRSTVDTILAAQQTHFEGTLDWSKGRCGLATVRDLPDPAPDKNRIVCGFNLSGRPDDTLLVGRVTDLTGTTRATLVNYACHPTTLAWQNRAISPDYIGAMRETIQTNTNAPALFLQGVSGELAPRYQYVADTNVADAHGWQLGFAALATLNGMEPPESQLVYRETVESGAPLAVWTHEFRKPSKILRSVETTVELPLKDWPSADALEDERSRCTNRALEERLRRKRDIRRSLGDGSRFHLPIHVLRIGDAVLVGCCCEAYSVLQRELRRRFADRSIICMNLINGSIGYLPPADLYDSDVYPVWQTPFDRGSLELTIESMTQAIHDVLD